MIQKPELFDLRHRWGIIEHARFPHYYFPCNVRILMYADFGGAYDGPSFGGLKHVIKTLTFDPYYWVKFSVTKASRVNDSSADSAFRSKRLDEIDLSKFDEIWFFGFGSGNALTPGEVTVLKNFMDVQGGGVLVTGDHATLGSAIGQQVPRAGKMRKWTSSPSQGGLDRHSTLREGHEPGFDFNDQSDDVPQQIRLKQYFLGYSGPFLRRYRPHEVLCGPDGPIDVFPDHMHEGEAIAPTTSLDPIEWRKNSSGAQELPEVIAWGKIVQGGLSKSGTEFGVVSVYNGHNVAEGTFNNVGRVIADSTWHHWFDINLIGVSGSLNPDTQGFPVSSSGQAVLKKIEAYFLNVAIWLAPKVKQQCMWRRILWGAIWFDPVFMTSPKELPYLLGKSAIDSLGRFAPQCTIYRLLWDWAYTIPKFKYVLDDYIKKEQVVLPELEYFVMGVGMRNLLSVMHERNLYAEEKFDEKLVNQLIDDSFKNAFKTGMQELVKHLKAIYTYSEELSKLD